MSLRQNADTAPPHAVPPQQVTPAPFPAPQLPTTLPGGATLNFYLDGYLEDNLNNPVGCLNDLHAYDVQSRAFSHEGPDQLHTLVLFLFPALLPRGVRLHYNFTDKFGVNCRVVNGTNQSEPNNGYCDEMFGFVTQPKKTLSWTFIYYLGHEHPDTVQATNCTVPVQPGLCLAPLQPAADGKLHIFDSYTTWNASPKLTLALEGDCHPARVGQCSAGPVIRALAYRRRGSIRTILVSPRQYVAARTEYLSDRGGMFSNATQALKEVTGTYRYNFGDGFSAFLEYRRDWSNRP